MFGNLPEVTQLGSQHLIPARRSCRPVVEHPPWSHLPEQPILALPGTLLGLTLKASQTSKPLILGELKQLAAGGFLGTRVCTRSPQKAASSGTVHSSLWAGFRARF